MSNELVYIMFKAVAEGNMDKAEVALSQYLNATGKHIQSLNEGYKNSYRVKIKDQHKAAYPEHLHGRLLQKTQPYRNPSEGGAYVQVSPDNVGEDLKHHVEVPIHHIERMNESVNEVVSNWGNDDTAPIGYTAPSEWASYLINGDDSGIDDEDKRAADEWVASIGHGSPVNCTDAGFIHHHDAYNVMPLGANCETYYFYRDEPAKDEDGEYVDESLSADASVKDYIDDFAKSDAPQFKGKSKAKRREMAIAASYKNKE